MTRSRSRTPGRCGAAARSRMSRRISSANSRGNALSYSTIGPSTVTSNPLDLRVSSVVDQRRKVLILPRGGEKNLVDPVVHEEVIEHVLQQPSDRRGESRATPAHGRSAGAGRRLHDIHVGQRRREPNPQMRRTAVADEEIIGPFGPASCKSRRRGAADWSGGSSGRRETRT